jgi:hypothetical protein
LLQLEWLDWLAMFRAQHHRQGFAFMIFTSFLRGAMRSTQKAPGAAPHQAPGQFPNRLKVIHKKFVIGSVHRRARRHLPMQKPSQKKKKKLFPAI